MSAQIILGLCSVVLAIISVIVIPLFVVFFRMGKSASILERHGEDIDSLKAKSDSHANDLSGLLAVLGPLKDKLDEMSQDVKSLLTGRLGRGPTDS